MDLGELIEIVEADPATVDLPEPIEVPEDGDYSAEPEHLPVETPSTPEVVPV